MPADLEWRFWRDEMDVPWLAVVPKDDPNNYTLRRVASIYWSEGRQQWCASWPAGKLAHRDLSRCVRAIEKAIKELT